MEEITVVKGTEVVLEGYQKPAVTGSIKDTDNANEAIGKLEKGADQYMKIEDYTLETNRAVVKQAKETEYALMANKLFDSPEPGTAQTIISVGDIKKIGQTANDAKTAAATADSKADTALSMADAADNKAGAAQITADEAKSAAAIADGKAVAAQGTADSAQKAANDANEALAGKVDKVVGKELSTNDYTTAEKEKLAGIEAEANKYVHPATHPASMIEGLPEVVQATGFSTTAVMSQKAVTDTIESRVNGVDKGDIEPIGTYKFFAGKTLPEGYLWCDGTSYPMNGDYKRLYDAIGTLYNLPGDEEETFRVPDMRGRVGVGKNAGTFNALGKTGGEEAHTLNGAELPTHGHSIPTLSGTAANAGAHVHGVKTAINSGGSNVGYCAIADGWKWNGSLFYNTGIAENNGLHSHSVSTYASNTGNVGSNTAHNNLQPYLVCNYIIRYARSYGEIGVAAPPCIWNIAAADWQAQAGGGYKLDIPANKHGRGEYCVLTALYKDAGSGSLKQITPDMQKDSVGNITLSSDVAFAGKAYIDSAYMQSAGRVVTVNGQKPDKIGNVNVFENPIVLGESNYGTVLPESLQKGQLFFLIEE